MEAERLTMQKEMGDSTDPHFCKEQWEIGRKREGGAFFLLKI